MSPLNSSNADSQGIVFQLDDSNNTAIISGYQDLNTNDIIIKRGVSDTNGKCYKVVSMTSDCLTSATSITSITFDKTNLSEFTYDINGFPSSSSLTFITFKDDILSLT